MDEDNLSQALVIGVTTFIGIIVVSAIIMFYNSSIRIVKSVGQGNDFSSVNRSDIESTLLMSGSGNYIKGTNVINLINYYTSDINTIITVQNIKYFDSNGDLKVIDNITMDSQEISVREANYSSLIRYIMDNQDFTIESQDINDIGSKMITIKGV